MSDKVEVTIGSGVSEELFARGLNPDDAIKYVNRYILAFFGKQFVLQSLEVEDRQKELGHNAINFTAYDKDQVQTVSFAWSIDAIEIKKEHNCTYTNRIIGAE